METRRTYVFVHFDEGPAPAGLLTLMEDGRNSSATFAYGRRYLQRKGRVAVDPVTLPLHDADVERVYRTDEDFAVFNGIRDAGPDGWGRYLMYKAVGNRMLTEMDYLLASGDYRVGALAFGPTPEKPERVRPWGIEDPPGEHFALEDLAEAAERVQDVDELDDDLRILLAAGSPLGGARPKAVTDLGGQLWIAKFPARDDPVPICKIEYGTMRLAVECGLDVPDLGLRSHFGRDIYLIKRFDRRAEGNRLTRTPFVSGLTMLAAHERDVGLHGYSDLAAAVRQYGSQVKRDLLELYRRMVFNILVNNDDDHLRNHGFLWDKRGWRLSPLYDVVPRAQISHDRNLALKVGPDGRAATLANAVAGAPAFNLTPDEAKPIVEQLRETVRTRWEAHYLDAGLSAGDRRRFATSFRQADAATDS